MAKRKAVGEFEFKLRFNRFLRIARRERRSRYDASNWNVSFENDDTPCLSYSYPLYLLQLCHLFPRFLWRHARDIFNSPTAWRTIGTESTDLPSPDRNLPLTSNKIAPKRSVILNKTESSRVLFALKNEKVRKGEKNDRKRKRKEKKKRNKKGNYSRPKCWLCSGRRGGNDI